MYVIPTFSKTKFKKVTMIKKKLNLKIMTKNDKLAKMIHLIIDSSKLN